MVRGQQHVTSNMQPVAGLTQLFLIIVCCSLLAAQNVLTAKSITLFEGEAQDPGHCEVWHEAMATSSLQVSAHACQVSDAKVMKKLQGYILNGQLMRSLVYVESIPVFGSRAPNFSHPIQSNKTEERAHCCPRSQAAIAEL